MTMMRTLQSLDSALIGSAGVPGLSVAAIRQGELAHIFSLGVRDTRMKDPVNAETVFEAASLSKPLVAFAALQLVDIGKLDLDEPLSRIVPVIVPTDSESSSITARHVLTHTTGLPNWRRDEYPLRTYFSPGSYALEFLPKLVIIGEFFAVSRSFSSNLSRNYVRQYGCVRFSSSLTNYICN